MNQLKQLRHAIMLEQPSVSRVLCIIDEMIAGTYVAPKVSVSSRLLTSVEVDDFLRGVIHRSYWE